MCAQTSKLQSDTARLEARCSELETAMRAALSDAATWRARYEDLARRSGGGAPGTPLTSMDRRVRSTRGTRNKGSGGHEEGLWEVWRGA